MKHIEKNAVVHRLVRVCLDELNPTNKNRIAGYLTGMSKVGRPENPVNLELIQLARWARKNSV